MDAIWTYVQHAYLIPSYMVGSFFLVILVILTERKNLTATLVWGGLFSLCPYMALSDGIYHGTLYLLSQMMGNIPLLADVILDYMSRLVLIPVAIYVFQKKLSIHWSLSLFLLSAFGGIGYLGMVVGKTQFAAFIVDFLAIILWWILLANELRFVRNAQTFRRFGFLGVFTSFSLLVNLAMYVCVRMIEVTPEFLDYLVFVSCLFWLTLTVAVKLIFRAVRLEQQAEIARNHDQLTGLPNEILFSNYVQELVLSSREKNLAFVVFDLDSFKAFNEKNGFEEGDAVLRFTARTLKAFFGERYVTRVSSDIFRVVAPESGLDEKIGIIHERIRSFSTQGELELKAGFCIQPCPVDNPEEIEKCFMRARLAEATIKGIYDKISVGYEDRMGAQARLKMYLVSHIDEAIQKGYVQVYYQPVICANTYSLCGFEALARWIDPVHGFLSPLDFISILEEAHLIHKLDLFMLEKVCENYRKETDLGHVCVPVSFNLSRLDFKLCDIYAEVEGLTQKYRVPHHMLHLEITESVLEGDDGEVLEYVKRFREEGFEVWMDDFGSGFSSLNVLKDYDFDFIKIDMIFLRNFTAKSKVIIQSVVEMAKNLGLGTLTEGVETEEHLNFLRKIGCDRLQGYYFSKPLPYGEVMQVLKAKGITAFS